MSRILEYQRSDQATVVSRILLELHRTIDKEFPTINAGSKQFTKTVLTSATSLDTKSQSPGISDSIDKGTKDPSAKDSRDQNVAQRNLTQASNSSSPFASSAAFPLNSGVASNLGSKIESSAIQNTNFDSASYRGNSLLKTSYRLFLLALLILGLCILGWLLIKGPEFPQFLKK